MMGRMTPQEVEKLAELARLSISAERKASFGREIEAILRYVSEIKNIAGGTPAEDVHAPGNVLREDGVPHESGAFTDALLNSAPKTADGYITVKNIF